MSGAPNGWTGGQYSAFRIALGLYLTVHFARLLPWSTELFSDQGALPLDGSPLLHLFPNVLAAHDSPAAVALLLLLGTLASFLLTLGWHDRPAALISWYVLACLVGRNPWTGSAALPFAGWLLLAHACLPAAPYGSLAARGRVDPDGGWQMSQAIFLAAWVVLAMTWSSPALGLLMVPLALIGRLRPWLWLLVVGAHVGPRLTGLHPGGESGAMLLWYGFTFDPAWVKPAQATAKETIFYDGECGLCHAFVRFVLAEDRSATFDLAPLDSEHFRSRVPPATRGTVGDTVVVRTADGEILTRSRAVRHVLGRLGGLWRVLAVASRIVPAPLLDLAYDGVTRVRRRLFRVPAGACPMLPPHLAARFHA